MKKWKNDNAPREASRALQSTRPQGTTPSARARSRGRTSQKGSATRRCRAFGGCIESVGEFFLLEGERTRTDEKRKKGKKRERSAGGAGPRASFPSVSDQSRFKNNDLAPLSLPHLWTRYSTLSLTRTVRPPDPAVMDAPAATTEWPEEPRPIGEQESGDGGGRARATRASPLFASAGDAELLPLGTQESAALLNVRGEAAAAAAADELGEEKACAAAAKEGVEASGERRCRKTDDAAAEQRPEVDAALCDVALIERRVQWGHYARKGGVRRTRTQAREKRRDDHLGQWTPTNYFFLQFFFPSKRQRHKQPSPAPSPSPSPSRPQRERRRRQARRERIDLHRRRLVLVLLLLLLLRLPLPSSVVVPLERPAGRRRRQRQRRGQRPARQRVH